MNIAMVFDGLQRGGVERVGADYAKLFCELGHTVTIINLNPSLREMENEFPVNCRIVHFKYSKKFAPEQYTQLIKRGDIYKLIYPIICIVLNLFNVIYKLLCKKNKILREKFDLAIAFAGHFNDLTFVSKEYIKNANKLCWLHGALYSYLLISDGYLNLYKKIRNLIVLVDDAQEEVLCYNNLHLNIHKLYNPTFIQNNFLDLYTVENLKKKYGKFLIMVSRFEYPHKDHYTVAKSLEIVRNKYGEDVNLLFVGSGPDENKIKKYVNSLSRDTKEHIFFIGNQKNIQNYYKASFMLVHASVAGEGLPTVMLEAMMYGIPMVVTDSRTGPREILKDNKYGLLCKVQDPHDMADKIVKLCKDDELYKHFQVEEKKRIKDFEPTTIKMQLKYIIDKVTSQ